MSYESWRIQFQSSEQAARSAYMEMMRIMEELAKLKREKLNETEN